MKRVLLIGGVVVTVLSIMALVVIKIINSVRDIVETASKTSPTVPGFDWVLWAAVLILFGGVTYELKYAGKVSRRLTTAVVVSAVFVLLGYLIFGAEAPKVWKKVQSGASSMVLSESDKTPSLLPPMSLPEGRVWTTMHVVWDEMNPDGTIPMNTPSKPVEIKPGCTIAYSSRNGIDYVVLYNEIGGGWEMVKPGQSTLGDKIKFMVIRRGVKELTYEHSCP
jgi:hypothetical protein